MASGDDILPASINVRAEMDTLVAVKRTAEKARGRPGEPKQIADASSKKKWPDDS